MAASKTAEGTRRDAAVKPRKRPVRPKPGELTRKGTPAKPQGGKREGAGRPSKLPGLDLEKLCERIAIGKVRPEVAAAEQGISPTTFARWLVEAQQRKTPELIEFGEKIAQAKLRAEGRLVDRTLKGDSSKFSFGPARASLELLGRTVRHYHPKIRLGVEEETRRVMEAVRKCVDDETFDRILTEIQAGEEGEPAEG